MSLTSGNRRSTISAEPSAEALSTTMTSMLRHVRATARLSRHSSTYRLVFQPTIMIEISITYKGRVYCSPPLAPRAGTGKAQYAGAAAERAMKGNACPDDCGRDGAVGHSHWRHVRSVYA